ncbi:MAG: DUF1801 domain-containing protein [Thaumarchaeota archaeon]|nr:DUF1801 domain-containing protein [Nitrososphaerota archaeon]
MLTQKDVCGIYASGDHINLSFSNGATMNDPRALIEGTGKNMRHIKIFDVDDVGEDSIKSYVIEPVAAAMKGRTSNRDATRTSHSC